jgi:RNA 2',3'-cyclic 3'-phosphodiesterase
MRLFVAADLPGEVRVRLGAVQKALARLPLQVRWTRPEGIHLTLTFIGEVPDDRVDRIRAALRDCGCRAMAPAALAAHGVGVFPDRGRPRVLWVGVVGEIEAAGRVKRAVDEALAPVGVVPEDRPFRPHLTLGRVTGARDGGWRAALEPHAAEEFGAFMLAACVLFESRLGAGGARYHALESVPLAGGVAA